jgi:hypothetical protein
MMPYVGDPYGVNNGAQGDAYGVNNGAHLENC